MSFFPPRALKRIFPPIVTGTVIFLIGASLIGSSGIPNWGGGSNDCQNRPDSGLYVLCPDINAPRPLPYVPLFFLLLMSVPIRYPDGGLQNSLELGFFRSSQSSSQKYLDRLL